MHLNNWHSQAIADATQTGCVKFTRVKFLAALQSVWQKPLKGVQSDMDSEILV